MEAVELREDKGEYLSLLKATINGVEKLNRLNEYNLKAYAEKNYNLTAGLTSNKRTNKNDYDNND